MQQSGALKLTCVQWLQRRLLRRLHQMPDLYWSLLACCVSLLLLDLLLTVAPYHRLASVDQEMEDSGPLTCAPVQLQKAAAEFILADSTAGSTGWGPWTRSICTKNA